MTSRGAEESGCVPHEEPLPEVAEGEEDWEEEHQDPAQEGAQLEALLWPGERPQVGVGFWVEVWPGEASAKAGNGVHSSQCAP